MNDSHTESNNDKGSSPLPLVIRVVKKSSGSAGVTVTTITDGTATATDDDGMTNSITVTLDTYVCGHCQLEYVDITEFMGHRLQRKYYIGQYLSL